MVPRVALLLAGLSFVTGFIIPEELPSLLSLLYSNIPPVKKGTDSRVGFGFKLGPHADFQVMLELGPQVNTAPIGPNAEPQGKRETLKMENTDTLVNMINTGKMPLPQYDTLPQESIEQNEVVTKTEKVSNSFGGKWIDSWKNAFSKGSYFGKVKFKPVPGIDNRRDYIQLPQRPKRLNFVDQLRKLYRPQNGNS